MKGDVPDGNRWLSPASTDLDANGLRGFLIVVHELTKQL